ncbi:unnamed protein product [Mucor hiemalis]
MGDSDIKSSLHDIKEVLDTVDNIKSEVYHYWDIEYMKKPSRLPLEEEDIVRSCKTYLFSRLFPSSTTTDFLDREELEVFDRFVRYDVLEGAFQNLWITIKIKPSIYTFPVPWQLEQPHLTNPSKDMQLTVSSVEMVENVFKPVYERAKVNQYFQNVLRGARGSIEAVILVGRFCNNMYLVELIENTCKLEGTRVVYSHGMSDPSLRESNLIMWGAIVKGMDKLSADIRRPRVILDEEFPIQSESKVPEVFVFIEYGDKISRASYIHHQQEQLPHGENNKHIVDWVEQSVLVWDFPTIEVMLIPDHKHDKSIRNLVSLKNNADHRNQFLELTKGDVAYNEYFTFRKGRQGIIMYTHSRDVTGKSTHTPDKESRDQSNLGSCVNGTKHFSGTLVEALLDPRVQTFDTHTNINGCDFTVTQKIITVQEFSTMYLKYLNTFLNDHIHLEIDARNYRFRFCITHVDTDGFRLTDEDIYLIANNVGMISTDLHLNNNTLLILKIEEAPAIHCRESLNGFDVNDQVTYSNFVQVQLTETQCVILLNSFPILGENDNIKNTLHEENWKSIHKRAKSKKVPINVMDIICENLWTYFQSQDHNLMKNCERHQSLHHFYNTKNMQIFKKLLLNYFSTTILDIEKDSEKVNEICVCENENQESCCIVRITTMNLLQFGISPAIDQLASIIQGGILNLCLHQEVHINEIFLMGVFLFCRYRRDYTVLEELLLIKLRNIKRQPSYKSLIRNLTKNTKNIPVTKLDVRKKEVEKYSHSGEHSQDALSRVALKGSISHGRDPRYRLLERFASKTYFVFLGVKRSSRRTIDHTMTYPYSFYNDEDYKDKDYSDFLLGKGGGIHVTCEQSKPPFRVRMGTEVYVIEKDTPLMSMALGREEISTYFTIHNYVEDVQIGIFFHTGEREETVFKVSLGKFGRGLLKLFCIDRTHPSYPIIFKTRISQTGSYKFWVEYGQNERTESFSISENVLLKTNHS